MTILIPACRILFHKVIHLENNILLFEEQKTKTCNGGTKTA